ncbi:hypothetical protein [Burkholderia gladioli]|uniref:hypothetical protein n=1 Tax=Burkholderia gladioli TaxID=28095 RepID=UPI001640C8B5|nr:hypothetical protein [Burkholderia gladioli]
MTNNTTAVLTDDFRGDDANLISSIKALIELNDEGALVPHGIGSHARSLLSAAAVRLTSPRAAVPAPAGWKLVPIEPTQAMLDCWWDGLPKGTAFLDCTPRGVYGAMLDAAPAAPVAEAKSAENAELASMTRMFHAACADLGLINEALGLDPDDGGAEPILDAIQKLKEERDQWADAGYAAQAVAADGAATDDLLETIDLKAEAGLCAMTHSGTRAFLKDIREIVKTARGAVSPATDDRICTLIPLSDRHPVTDDHPRVIVFTDGSDFNGAQFFDVSADSLNECFYESPDEQPDVSRHATHWMPRPSLHNAAPAPAEPCAHDYVRSDRVCTECGEKTATADERAAFETCGPEACTTADRCKAEQQCGWRTIGRASQAAAPAEAREPVATFDDGLKVYLDSWTGGRHEAGSFGEITLRFTDERHTNIRDYRAKDIAPADAGEAVAWICSGSNDFAPIVRDRAAALKLSQEHGDGKIVALGIVPDVVSQGAQGGKGGEA